MGCKQFRQGHGRLAVRRAWPLAGTGDLPDHHRRRCGELAPLRRSRRRPREALSGIEQPGASRNQRVSRHQPPRQPDHGLEPHQLAGPGRTQRCKPGAAVGVACPLLLWFPRTRACGKRGYAPADTSGAFCCGLADLPNGDFFFTQLRGRGSLALELRGDLWEHLRGPGRFTLGATLFWAFGSNFYEAVRQYYLGLVNAGIIKKR